jgi:hypothetical protein
MTDVRYTETGFVYLIADGAAVKIGRCSSVAPDIEAVEERLRMLQIGNPRPLTLLAYAWVQRRPSRVEHALHQRHAKHRLRGEWFNLSPAALRWSQAYLAEQAAAPAHFASALHADILRVVNALRPAPQPTMSHRVASAVNSGKVSTEGGFARRARLPQKKGASRHGAPDSSPLAPPPPHHP